MDLDLGKLQETLRGNLTKRRNRTKNNEDSEIRIALHLGKNSSYERQNSSVKIYQYKNVIPNFYYSINLNLTKSILVSQKSFTISWKSIYHDWYLNWTKPYHSLAKVLLYQHEPVGYATRDCLKMALGSQGKVLGKPLNAVNRKDWEPLPRKMKESFEFIYGGLSFGVCETLSHPCAYMTMVAHPLDRILNLYMKCRNDKKYQNSTMCTFPNLDILSMSVKQFIKVQGNSLFQKLLYHSKHCRLVGEDEICIEDGRTSFVLTQDERRAHLHNILTNLESWFSVIGLADQMDTSLMLFREVFGLNMSDCRLAADWMKSRAKPEYHQLRYTLLQDENVTRWLFADLAIYNKMEEIFKKQLKTFNTLKLYEYYFSQEGKVEKDALRYDSLTGTSSSTTHETLTTPNISNTGVKTQKDLAPDLRGKKRRMGTKAKSYSLNKRKSSNGIVMMQQSKGTSLTSPSKLKLRSSFENKIPSSNIKMQQLKRNSSMPPIRLKQRLLRYKKKISSNKETEARLLKRNSLGLHSIHNITPKIVTAKNKVYNDKEEKFDDAVSLESAWSKRTLTYYGFIKNMIKRYWG